MSNANKTYLTRFFDETSKVNRDEVFTAEGRGVVIHAEFTYGQIVDLIIDAPASEQAQIASTIRKIDFANGDVCHFLRFLGQQFVNTQAPGQ